MYCAEDVDNTWVQDHFKSVQLDPRCEVKEKMVMDPATKDTYVALTVVKGASVLKTESIRAAPEVEVKDLDKALQCEATILEELNLVPYYFRANRGGRGQARVGLRRWLR